MPYLERAGARIHYEVSGVGRAVILAHSFLCSGATWAPQLEPLARQFLVVNVDARGHGASGPAEDPFTLDDLLGDHLAVLDALEIRRAVWAGHSMGGMVALRAALQVPERVAGLVLLDTDGGPETLATRARYAALAGLARTVGLRPIAGRVAEIMFGRTTLRTNPGLVAAWTRSFAAFHVPSGLNALEAIVHREDLLPDLSAVTAPALVVVGDEDRGLPPERSQRLARALPRGRLVEIAGAGHLSTLEQPAAVTAAVLGFLDAIGWSTPSARPTPRPAESAAPA
jgi:pimeloyl-ACP methyl ester carboxylesterase